MVRTLLLIQSVLLFLSTAAQQKGLSFKNVTIIEGLSQNSVVDITQDSLGFMWFATQDGLNRFDGEKFKIFPEVFDDITSPGYSQLGKLFASGRKLWFVTKGGKLKLMDLCTEFIFPVERLGLDMDLIPPVSTIYEDSNDNLWIGTLENGIFHWNLKTNSYEHFVMNEEFPFSLAGNKVHSIFEDNEKNIWILTNQGITKIGMDKIENFLKGINASMLTQDEEGKLWLGTFGDGLYVKEPGAGKFQALKVFGRSTIPGNLIIEAIHADSAGKIWIGTYGNGVYVINKDSREMVHLLPERKNPFSIGFQDILSIEEDREGAVWLGTDGGGVSYYNPHFHSFKRLTDQEVPRDISIEQIRAISTDSDGGIWLGTSGKGLTYFSPESNELKTWHLKPYKPGISNYDRIVSLLADEEGDLWIGTQGNGLILKNRNTGQTRKWFFSEADKASEVIPDNTIWSLLSAGPKSVFAATRNAGVVLIHKDKGVLRTFPDIKEAGSSRKKNIRSMTKINDSILALGSEKSAIHLLNTCKGTFQSVSNPLVEETLNEEYGIKSLYYKDGFLWAGTAGQGLLVTHLESNKTTAFTSAQGLPNEMIYGMLPEGENSLWVSSNKGIFRLFYQQEGNVVKILQIQSFTVGDGLQSNEFNTGAYHKSANGTLFFGGINGLNFFAPEDVYHTRESAAVVLTDATIGNGPLQSDSLITYKKKLTVPYGSNSISFNYTILDFLSPETMNYQYILEGYDEEWIDAGTRKYTAYTNLPPGEYTFKVKPAERIFPVATPAVLGISVSTPFWLEWWFFILVFLFISGALYVFYRYRINQILEVQRVKNTISADLHDDIGSRLTSIQFLSALSRKNWMSGEDTKSCLEGIDEEVQASSEALNEIVWNIKMDDESLEDIVAKMRRYAGEVFENSRTRCSMEIDADFTGRKMGMQKRREVFLIFKELLNNVRKHAGAELVKITVSIEQNLFHLTVSDDGKGFDPSRESSRNGIKNMQERIKRWKGKMKISSRLQEGSTVEIWLPFDEFSFLWRVFGSSSKN